VPRWGRRLAIGAGLLLLADLGATLALALYWRGDSGEPPAAHYLALAVLHADTPPELHGTRRALDRALELYRTGRARQVLCIGGNRPATGLHAGEEMRAYLIAGGIPAEHIAIERESYDTRTNAQAIDKALEGSSAGPVAVIVYPAHQPRVRYHLRRQAPRVDALLIAPRANGSFARVAYESWTALHHEVAAWILTLALSEQAYADLLRRSRSGRPVDGVRSFQRLQADIVDAQFPGPVD
jgi:uncharacterized SAM-binding protein YcdF (DUF218 family)